MRVKRDKVTCAQTSQASPSRDDAICTDTVHKYVTYSRAVHKAKTRDPAEYGEEIKELGT